MNNELTPLLWSPKGIGTVSTNSLSMGWPGSRAVFIAGALTASCLLVVPDAAAPAVFFASGATADYALGSPAPLVPESRTALPSSASLIRDLKSRSGLTWEQLAGIFDVSRRALHGWASGARLNAYHSELLTSMRETLRRIESQGDAEATRLAMLEEVASGRGAALRSTDRGRANPFDLRSVRHEGESWPHRDGEVIAMVDAD